MKRVKLEYEHGVTINDEAFEQIAVIVKSNRVCETCEKPYTQERPQVSLNKCLPCFLRFHQSQFLTYVGVLEEREDYTVYGFLNPLGYIYPSFSNTENRDLNLSNAYTLKYYGYPVPSHVLLDTQTEEKYLDSSFWQMHGEFRKGQPVLLLEYNQPYGDHIKLLFLSYRNGEATLLDKQRGQGRKWFIEAKKTIEATKVGREYHWKGRDSYQIFTSDIYELVSTLASAEYDQRKPDTFAKEEKTTTSEEM
jgi:hypothetical protein